MGAAGWAKWRERLSPPEAASDLFAALPRATGKPAAPQRTDIFARLAALNNQD
jgi:hypothetical protein